MFSSKRGDDRQPARDPRDMTGKNPTGRERRSSAGTRRKAERRDQKETKS